MRFSGIDEIQLVQINLADSTPFVTVTTVGCLISGMKVCSRNYDNGHVTFKSVAYWVNRLHMCRPNSPKVRALAHLKRGYCHSY